MHEKPNFDAAARLLTFESNFSTANSGTDPAKLQKNGDDVDQSVPPAPSLGGCPNTLDLRACHLTDREVHVLINALVQGHAAPSSAASAEGSIADGALAVPLWQFSALLLSGNPGIGVHALEALWGGRGGIHDPKGLFPFLVRLELSRCGLAAADLAGLCPPRSSNDERDEYRVNGLPGGGGGFAAEKRSPASCLRTLILRDNPITRVGVAGGEESTHKLEAARKGLTVLRDFIARAHTLEVLDVSGEATTRQDRCFSRSTVTVRS